MEKAWATGAKHFDASEESMLQFKQYLRTRSRPTNLHTVSVRRGILLVVFCITSAVASMYAQVVTRPMSSERSELTILKQVQEVNFAFTVTDRRGRLVNNLTQSQLLILDNDQRAGQITYFESRTNLPLRIALVMDISDSVTYCLNSERKTAVTFLKRNLRPNRDRAAIIAFNETVRLVQSPTADLRLLTQSLKEVHVGGETAIYDAVATASHELARIPDSQPSRRVIVLITDGEDNRSHITLQQAADLALKNETAVYVVSTNSPSFPDTQDKGDQAMKQLARDTGGTFLNTKGDLDNAFLKIEKELRSQYVIGYKPPNTTPDGQFHRLKLLGPGRLRFFHRTGYFAK
jgi:Ca-activated chloride channel homolog